MTYRLRRAAQVVLLFSPAMLFFSCANQQPPDGGPVDTTPPEVVSFFPNQGALQFHDRRIVIEFSKYVEERTVEESIFISPYVGELEFDWSGKEVEVRFGQPLHERTTYVINLGTDVKDLKTPANRMASAFSLAFSTGDSLDRGAIEGKVLPRKFEGPASGVMIFAYKLEGVKTDTLNPRTSAPDYISQTGKDGSFFLHHVAFSAYRLFAVRDEYRNLAYEPEVDEFGIPSKDILLRDSDTLAGNIVMKLAVEDTSGPRLTKAEATAARHVSIEFSEDIDTARVNLLSIAIVDTANSRNLRLIAVYPSIGKLNQFIGETDLQDSSSSYRLGANVWDLAGNPILESASQFVFSGSGKKDSLRIKRVSIELKDSAENIELAPRFLASYSNSVHRTTVQSAWRLEEASGSEIPLTVHRISDIQFALAPILPLRTVSWYVLHHDGRGVRGIGGGSSTDSVRSWRFETLDADLLSSLEGIVLSPRSPEDRSPIIVQAYNLTKKDAPRLAVKTNTTGEFRFLSLDEGKYVLQAFVDENRNDVFDAGKPFPFVKPEPISDFSDTLKVRARWPLEGVIVRFR